MLVKLTRACPKTEIINDMGIWRRENSVKVEKGLDGNIDFEQVRSTKKTGRNPVRCGLETVTMQV